MKVKVCHKILVGMALLLGGCYSLGYLKSESKVNYLSEEQAVISFYKDNLHTLKSLTMKQEMLGWIVRCDDNYNYTKAYVGGLTNNIIPPYVDEGCKVVANMHTHPRMKIGMTSDFFSRADLHAASKWRMYLLAQENCHLRLTVDNKNRNGKLLGKLRDCK